MVIVWTHNIWGRQAAISLLTRLQRVTRILVLPGIVTGWQRSEDIHKNSGSLLLVWR